MDGLRDRRAPAQRSRRIAAPDVEGRGDRLKGRASLEDGVGAGLADQAKELVDENGIPLLAGSLLQDADRLLAGAAAPVGAVARHGYERVGDGDDAGEQRNLVAAQTVGIACAVNPLVVVADGRKQLVGTRQGSQDLLADDGVTLHLTELSRIEAAILGEYANRDTQGADVVQQGSFVKKGELLVG